MRPKIVEENILNFNAVSKDAVARFVRLKEACEQDDHIPDLDKELNRWSLEGKLIIPVFGAGAYSCGWNLHSALSVNLGSKGWRSGESARLPPICPGFKSRLRRHMWAEFVVGSLLCSEKFFFGYSGFPLSFPNSNSIRNRVDEEQLCGCATSRDYKGDREGIPHIHPIP